MSAVDEAKQRAFDFLQKFLNSSRKEGKSSNEKTAKKPTEAAEPEVDDDWLTKKAISELQREICINKVKRKAFGSVTVPKARTNKRFLATTLSQVLSHNNRETHRHQSKSTDKLKELERHDRLRKSEKKFGDRKHEFRKPEKEKKSKRKKEKKKRKRRSRSRSSSSSDD